MGIEWILFLGAYPRAAVILIHEPLDLFSPQNRLLYNLFCVLRLYFIVYQIIRHNFHNRPIFAESIAAGSLNFRNHLGLGPFCLCCLRECLGNLHAAICPASGTTAYKNLLLHLCSTTFPDILDNLS